MSSHIQGARYILKLNCLLILSLEIPSSPQPHVNFNLLSGAILLPQDLTSVAFLLEFTQVMKKLEIAEKWALPHAVHTACCPGKNSLRLCGHQPSSGGSTYFVLQAEGQFDVSIFCLPFYKAVITDVAMGITFFR